LSITGGRYEDKEFVKLVKDETKPFYNSQENKIIIDFTHVPVIKSWLNLELEIFKKIFYPKHSFSGFLKSIRKNGIDTPYNEQYADLVTMNYIGRPYLKSISSIRYGLESGLFTFILGMLYSLSIFFIWNYYNSNDFSKALYIGSIIITSVLTALIILTLCIRWVQSNKEYDSRLILHVVSALNSHHVKVDSLYEQLPQQIFDKLNRIEFNKGHIAVFQIDDFLFNKSFDKIMLDWFLANGRTIENDENEKPLEEQIFNELKKLKHNTRVDEVYKIIQFAKVNGLKNNTINKFEPNKSLLSLIYYLKSKGVNIILVSLFDKTIVEIFSWEYFGISSSQVIAPNIFSNPYHHKDNIVSEVDKELTDYLIDSNQKPLIIGCQSNCCNYLLEKLDENGFFITNQILPLRKDNVQNVSINQDRIINI